jgi:prefoldin subunit 5
MDSQNQQNKMNNQNQIYHRKIEYLEKQIQGLQINHKVEIDDLKYQLKSAQDSSR